MKKITIVLIIGLITGYGLIAQVAINNNGSDPDSTAMLDVQSNNRGVAIPQLTQSEIENMETPANGLTVFNTTDSKFYTYILALNEWKEIAFGEGRIFVDGQHICGYPLIDPRNGQSYATVEIGTQCWMAENLNIGTMINGSQEMSDDGIIERYCYDDNTANCDEYGAQYQWDEMMQYNNVPGRQGICPDGWHLPTDLEWYVLEHFADPTITLTTGWRGTDGGGKLKETGTTHWNSPNTGATDAFGFTGLPAGARHKVNQVHYLLGDKAIFWSSIENGSDAFCRTMAFDKAQMHRGADSKNYGFSVRCILGDSAINLPPGVPDNPSPEQGATGISSDTTLAWSCADPEGLPLTYNLYLGFDSDPPLFQTGISDTLFAPGFLHYDSTYYWRIVAIDLDGDSTSGPVWSFTTGSWECGYPIKDARDGLNYETVEIGSQCWMAENLNIGTMINASQEMSDDGIIERYCYDDNTANCDEYGAQYQWDEMMQYNNVPGRQGICPDGWHLPTDLEWYVLEHFADPTITLTTGWRGTDGGGKLKETGTTHWNSPNTGATDAFGFTGLPAGARHKVNQVHYLLGDKANFWSSNENGSDAFDRTLAFDKAQMARGADSKNYGYSVRCILGDSAINLPPGVPDNPSPEQGATGISSDTTLAWSCTDPEGLPLTFNLYLGFDSDPPLFQTGISDTLFSPGFLHYDSTYYWRVVAIDLEGDSTSGPVWSFTIEADPCGNPITDIRDGQSYNTVVIGSQCWMAENLNIGAMISGSNGQSDDGTIEKYCFNDNTANCDEYGGLYQWDEMMGYSTTPGIQGICPDGWHLPDDLEYFFLEQHVDSTIAYNTTGYRGIDGGGKLKEAGTTHWQDPNVGATNESGFTGLPGGYCNPNSSAFNGIGYYGFWWSSSENNTLEAWYRYLTKYNAQVNRTFDEKYYGYSVRCVRDLEVANVAPLIPADPAPADGSTDINVDTTLSWWCADPNGDVLTYDIYFGTENDPPLVQADHPDTQYDPGTLDFNFIYYWKIVAKDIHGNIQNGPVWSFTTEYPWICGDPFTDPRDGQIYETVQIGDQCWMSENMNIGTIIPLTQIQSDNGVIEKYCYDEDPANCDTYGGLYMNYEAFQYVFLPGTQGICPDGWHVPSHDEFKILEGTVDSQYPVGDPIWDNTWWRGYDAGQNLKSETGWINNGNGTDLYGFNVLPAGCNLHNQTSYNLGENAYFWLSESGDLRELEGGRSDISYRSNYNTYVGASVRCLLAEGATNQPPDEPSDPVPQDGASNVELNPILTWSCSDPDGDSLIYRVYFGTDPDPGLTTNWGPDTTYATETLDYSTTYYWKIIAKDIYNYNTESPVWSFTTMNDPCGNDIIDPRDGQSYATVKIGDQCWMAEDLNYGTMINGNQQMTDNGIAEKYCYGDNSASCEEYGGLYQWNEVMNYSNQTGVQGLCPEGWHIPGDNEWCMMEQFIDPTITCGSTGFRGTDGGGKLKEAGTAHWQSPNTGATNASGFTALPGGYRSVTGSFANITSKSNWWTSLDINGNLGWRRELAYNSSQVGRYNFDKEAGFGVRCVRDPFSANIFIKTYGGSDYDIPRHMILTSDGGIAMTGYTESFGAGMEDGMIIKTDENGSVQWANSYGWSGEGYFNAITETNDDGFITAGYHYNYTLDNYDMNFFRVEEDGDQIWTVFYDIGGNEVMNDVIQDSNGDIVAVGYQDANTFGLEDKSWIKIDMDHNIIFSKHGGGSESDKLTGIVETVNGGYAVCGHTRSFGNGWYDMCFNLLNNAGEILTSYTYGGTDQDYAYDLCSTSDSGFVLVGTTHSFGAGGADIYYRKVDSVGHTEWSYTIGNESYNHGRSVLEASDNCIVIWGDTHESGSDYWLIKLTMDGGQILWQTKVDVELSDYAVAITQGDDDCYYAIGKSYTYPGHWNFVLLKFAPDGSTCMISDNNKGFKELPEGSVIQQYFGDNAIISPVLMDEKNIPKEFNKSDENTPKITIQPNEDVTPVTPTVNTICEW